jgi:hypothetical protein
MRLLLMHPLVHIQKISFSFLDKKIEIQVLYLTQDNPEFLHS